MEELFKRWWHKGRKLKGFHQDRMYSSHFFLFKYTYRMCAYKGNLVFKLRDQIVLAFELNQEVFLYVLVMRSISPAWNRFKSQPKHERKRGREMEENCRIISLSLCLCERERERERESSMSSTQPALSLSVFSFVSCFLLR